MIQASELRIGNLIQGNKGDIWCLTIDMLRSIAKGDATECTGIPLTEEWLLKLGLHRQTGEIYTMYHENRLIFTLYNMSLVIEGIFMPRKIQYLHQLQNLCFALTGEELIIKKLETL